MTSSRTRRPAQAAAVVLSCALFFTACSGDDDADQAAEDPTTQGIETDTAEPTDTGTPVAAGDPTEVEIGETINDPEMGDTVEVVSAVRDFPSEEQAELIADGGEVVLVQVEVVPGQEYGGRLSTGNFAISWDDGADFWNDDTRMIEEEMAAAEQPALADISRRDGGEHTGWVAFFVDERADTYLLEYERPGAKVIGSDTEIEELLKEIEIPAV